MIEFYSTKENRVVAMSDDEYVDHGYLEEGYLRAKIYDWLGLHHAIKEAYPNGPVDANIICSGATGNAYRFVSGILKENRDQAERIKILESLVSELRDALQHIEDRASEWASYADQELAKATKQGN